MITIDSIQKQTLYILEVWYLGFSKAMIQW